METCPISKLLWGEPRATQDLELVVKIPIRAINKLSKELEKRDMLIPAEITFRKTADSLRASVGSSELDIAHQVALHGMLAHWGFFQFRLGKGEQAYNILSPSAAFLRPSAAPFAAVYSHMYLGINCWILGKLAEAKESYQTSRALARENGARWHEALDSEFLGGSQ